MASPTYIVTDTYHGIKYFGIFDEEPNSSLHAVLNSGSMRVCLYSVNVMCKQLVGFL